MDKGTCDKSSCSSQGSKIPRPMSTCDRGSCAAAKSGPSAQPSATAKIVTCNKSTCGKGSEVPSVASSASCGPGTCKKAPAFAPAPEPARKIGACGPGTCGAKSKSSTFSTESSSSCGPGTCSSKTPKSLVVSVKSSSSCGPGTCGAKTSKSLMVSAKASGGCGPGTCGAKTSKSPVVPAKTSGGCGPGTCGSKTSKSPVVPAKTSGGCGPGTCGAKGNVAPVAPSAGGCGPDSCKDIKPLQSQVELCINPKMCLTPSLDTLSFICQQQNIQCNGINIDLASLHSMLSGPGPYQIPLNLTITMADQMKFMEEQKVLIMTYTLDYVYYEPYMEEIFDNPCGYDDGIYKQLFIESPLEYEPYMGSLLSYMCDTIQVQTDLMLGPLLQSLSLSSMDDGDTGVGKCVPNTEMPWGKIILPPSGTYTIIESRRKPKVAFEDALKAESGAKTDEGDETTEGEGGETSEEMSEESPMSREGDTSESEGDEDEGEGEEDDGKVAEGEGKSSQFPEFIFEYSLKYNEHYMEPLFRKYPDVRLSTSPCPSWTEMPWDDILIPTNVTIIKLDKPKRPKPKKPCSCKKKGSELSVIMAPARKAQSETASSKTTTCATDSKSDVKIVGKNKPCTCRSRPCVKGAVGTKSQSRVTIVSPPRVTTPSKPEVRKSCSCTNRPTLKSAPTTISAASTASTSSGKNCSTCGQKYPCTCTGIVCGKSSAPNLSTPKSVCACKKTTSKASFAPIAPSPKSSTASTKPCSCKKSLGAVASEVSGMVLDVVTLSATSSSKPCTCKKSLGAVTSEVSGLCLDIVTLPAEGSKAQCTKCGQKWPCGCTGLVCDKPDSKKTCDVCGKTPPCACTGLVCKKSTTVSFATAAKLCSCPSGVKCTCTGLVCHKSTSITEKKCPCKGPCDCSGLVCSKSVAASPSAASVKKCPCKGPCDCSGLVCSKSVAASPSAPTVKKCPCKGPCECSGLVCGSISKESVKSKKCACTLRPCKHGSTLSTTKSSPEINKKCKCKWECNCSGLVCGKECSAPSEVKIGDKKCPCSGPCDCTGLVCGKASAVCAPTSVATSTVSAVASKKSCACTLRPCQKGKLSAVSVSVTSEKKCACSGPCDCTGLVCGKASAALAPVASKKSCACSLRPCQKGKLATPAISATTTEKKCACTGPCTCTGLICGKSGAALAPEVPVGKKCKCTGPCTCTGMVCGAALVPEEPIAKKCGCTGPCTCTGIVCGTAAPVVPTSGIPESAKSCICLRCSPLRNALGPSSGAGEIQCICPRCSRQKGASMSFSGATGHADCICPRCSALRGASGAVMGEECICPRCSQLKGTSVSFATAPADISKSTTTADGKKSKCACTSPPTVKATSTSVEPSDVAIGGKKPCTCKKASKVLIDERSRSATVAAPARQKCKCGAASSRSISAPPRVASPYGTTSSDVLNVTEYKSPMIQYENTARMTSTATQPSTGMFGSCQPGQEYQGYNQIPQMGNMGFMIPQEVAGTNNAICIIIPPINFGRPPPMAGPFGPMQPQPVDQFNLPPCTCAGPARPVPPPAPPTFMASPPPDQLNRPPCTCSRQARPVPPPVSSSHMGPPSGARTPQPYPPATGSRVGFATTPSKSPCQVQAATSASSYATQSKSCQHQCSRASRTLATDTTVAKIRNKFGTKVPYVGLNQPQEDEQVPENTRRLSKYNAKEAHDDPVGYALRSYEEEMKPLKEALTTLQSKIRALNMPELKDNSTRSVGMRMGLPPPPNLEENFFHARPVSPAIIKSKVNIRAKKKGTKTRTLMRVHPKHKMIPPGVIMPPMQPQIPMIYTSPPQYYPQAMPAPYPAPNYVQFAPNPDYMPAMPSAFLTELPSSSGILKTASSASRSSPIGVSNDKLEYIASSDSYMPNKSNSYHSGASSTYKKDINELVAPRDHVSSQSVLGSRNSRCSCNSNYPPDYLRLRPGEAIRTDPDLFGPTRTVCSRSSSQRK